MLALHDLRGALNRRNFGFELASAHEPIRRHRRSRPIPNLASVGAWSGESSISDAEASVWGKDLLATSVVHRRLRPLSAVAIPEVLYKPSGEAQMAS